VLPRCAFFARKNAVDAGPGVSRGFFILWRLNLPGLRCKNLSSGESWLHNRDAYRRTAKAGAVLAGILFLAGLTRAQNAQAPSPAPAAPTEKAPTAKTPPSSATDVAPSSPEKRRQAGALQTYRDVVDELGRTVRVPQPVERIVSLAPNLTETVYALGLQDHLVGDTDYCDYPADAQKKAKVGGTINPSLEEVAALRPDLVLVASINRFETLRALDELKIPTYATDPHNISEIIASTEKLANVLGAADAGTALANDLEQRLAGLQRRVGELPARRVLFVVWKEPLISIGKNTFIADALSKAGAVSIVDATQDWPHLSLEEAVRLQPEFLVFTAPHDEKSAAAELPALSSLPGWRSLEAVKNHHVAVISEAVNRPAPRIISAIEELARQLHPEAFQDALPIAPPSGDTDKPVNPAPEKNPPTALQKPGSRVREDSEVTEVYACDR